MVLLVLQGFVSLGFGHNNGWGTSEYSVHQRRENILTDYRFETHYGAHDWIAESALRVIQESSYSSYIINWLYDDNLNIPYKDFDEYSSESVGFHSTWWAVNNYQNYPQLFGTDSLQETRYLFARRLFYFLHGTLWPDRMPGIIQILTDLSSEYIALNEPWMRYEANSYLRIHNIHFWKTTSSLPSDPNSNKYIPSRYLGDHHGLAAELCQCAALTALYCLNVKQKFWYKERNDDGEYVSKNSVWHGKYDAAAKCIGALTHFIADVSVPHHTDASHLSYEHRRWEDYVQYEFLMKFDKTLANGRPCWDIIDPRSLITSEGLDIKPILPYIAAISMAEKTFLACDEGSNKDVYAYDDQTGSPPYLCAPALIDFDLGATSDPYHSEIAERARKLVSYAVYYAACAILWICELAKMNERTKEHTTEKRLIKVGISTKLKVPSAVSVDQIRDWGHINLPNEMDHWLTSRGVDPLLASEWAQSFSMSLFVLVPIIALSSAFILQGVLEDPLKKLKS